jgi:hypothetical protein
VSLSPGFRRTLPVGCALGTRRPALEDAAEAAELGVAAMAEGAAELGGAVLVMGSALGTLEGTRRAMAVHRPINPSTTDGGGGGGGGGV